jgi:hypothetical protein
MAPLSGRSIYGHRDGWLSGSVIHCDTVLFALLLLLMQLL